MKSYILLVSTWAITLAMTILLWLQHNLAPPAWIVGALVGIAVIPLAQRLKIGNWFEFNRKIGKLEEQYTSVQQDVERVKNQFNAFITGTQSQQQINLSLLTAEAARAFAQNISIETKDKYPPITEDISKREKNILAFIYNADNALEALKPLLRILYALIITKRGKALSTTLAVSIIKDEKVLIKDTSALAEEVKEHFADVLPESAARRKPESLFKPVIELIDLRKRVDEDETKMSPIKDCKKLVKQVWDTHYYILGMISAGFVVAFNPQILFNKLDKQEDKEEQEGD